MKRQINCQADTRTDYELAISATDIAEDMGLLFAESTKADEAFYSRRAAERPEL